MPVETIKVDVVLGVGFNLHRVHHRHPLASWASLPDLFAADRDGFASPLLETGLKQLKGPLRGPPRPSTQTEIRQAAE
jgi:fatty acid desaturase